MKQALDIQVAPEVPAFVFLYGTVRVGREGLCRGLAHRPLREVLRAGWNHHRSGERRAPGLEGIQRVISF